jgi:hypothetical protein
VRRLADGSLQSLKPLLHGSAGVDRPLIELVLVDILEGLLEEVFVVEDLLGELFEEFLLRLRMNRALPNRVRRSRGTRRQIPTQPLRRLDGVLQEIFFVLVLFFVLELIVFLGLFLLVLV